MNQQQNQHLAKSFIDWATLNCPAFYPAKRRQTIKPYAHLTFFAIALAFNGNVYASDTTRHYQIPAQSLNNALMRFAADANLELVFSADKVRGLTANKLDGTMTAAQALSRLLQDSGLTYRFINAHSVTLERSASPLKKTGTPPQPVTNGQGADTTLPTVNVKGAAMDEAEYYADPYNKDYVIPNATAGTKTDTPIMETPLNVQVISKQVLKDQQITRLDQAVRNVSGVTTNQNLFANDFFLRGFESHTLFRNGFRMNENGWNDAQQFANVEKIEVLKGSAATLFGRVEPGGIINIITKQPLAKPYYALNQQFGSFDKYRTSVDVGGPLSKDDSLLYRVNGSYQANNSFRDLVTDDNVFFAPIMKWNISPKTQMTLEVEYQRDQRAFDVQVLPFDEASNRVLVLDNVSHNLNFGESNPLRTENIFVGMNWSHQFNDAWAIKHQVSYKRNEENQSYSLLPFIIDRTNRTVERLAFRGDFVDDTVATNVDLTGHFKTWALEHTLLFGGDYYLFESSDGALNALDPSAPALVNLDHPVHPTPGPFLAPNNNPFTQITDNYGLYLQDQIKLPYHVEIMGGVRYQYVKTTNDEGFGTDGGGISVLASDEAATPRVGLSWQPQNWLSLYSNYTENFGAQAGARAFKEGTAGTPLSPQTAQQWEIGAKTEFFDGRLRATLAYYDLTKQNVATTDSAHITECNGPCSVAAGEVNSHGPELDIQGEILPGWNLIATYANLNVHITKSTETATTNNAFLEGQRLQYVPRNTGSFWTTYEAQQGILKGFKLGGGVNLQDGVVDATNTIHSPGFTLVGLMAGYSIHIGKAKITTQLNVENLFDESYYKNASVIGSGAALVNFSTPRTFMGSVNIQY